MLQVESRGSGADVVVLHGTPQDPRTFLEVAVDARVHVIHAPGHHGSPHAPPLDDAEAVVRAIAETIAAMRLEAPVLVGCSAGAYRALSMCLDGLVQPRALGLCGGFAGLTADHRAALAGLADALDAGADLREALAGASFSASFRAREPERAARYVDATLASCPPTLIARDLRGAVGSRDRTADLAPLPYPVSIVVGAEDTAVPEPYSEVLARGLGVTHRVLPGVGHVPHVESPELWRAWIAELVGR